MCEKGGLSVYQTAQISPLVGVSPGPLPHVSFDCYLSLHNRAYTHIGGYKYSIV